MNMIDLGGHSGCSILLCEQDGSPVFVRKISSTGEYNERLKRQSQKQQAFVSASIKTPKIFNSGYTENGLYYFDMEYIRGVSLSEYIGRMEISKIKGLVDILISNAMPDKLQEAGQAAGPEYAGENKKLFAQKISLLSSQLIKEESRTVREALKLLVHHDWSLFTESACHGDLTLENILIKGDSVYLIDFLDSFYDSWLIDMGTLLQDIWCLWSYRYQDEVNINTLIRLIVFHDILIDELKRKLGKSYVEAYFSLLLKLLRIFPYCKDEKTHTFLIEKVKAVLELINREEVI